jgi:hypothetical protein
MYHILLQNNPQVGHTFHLWLIPFKEKNMTDAPSWIVLPPQSIILVLAMKGILSNRRISCEEGCVPHSCDMSQELPEFNDNRLYLS